jgi:hypothetical protein
VSPTPTVPAPFSPQGGQPAKHRRGAISPGTVAIAVWIVLGVVLWFFYGWIDEVLWMLSFLPYALWIVVGINLLAFSFMFKYRWRATAVRAVVLTAVTVLSLSYGSRLSIAGRRFLLHWRLARVAPELERLSSQIAAGRGQPTPGEHKGSFGVYIIDVGPPVRIAVPLPGGILDNWCGLVRDPTGLVMSPRSTIPRGNGHETRFAWGLFGGVLVSCKPLGPPWYHCCFS